MAISFLHRERTIAAADYSRWLIPPAALCVHLCMMGRFFWSSTSDYIGRKNTYFIFFALGAVLYALVPIPARSVA